MQCDTKVCLRSKFYSWIVTDLEESQLMISHVFKRPYVLKYWEPIYIADKSLVDFNERLSWEGRRDKMVQGFEMCLANYDFAILNNGFVIHRGIKKTDLLEPNEKIKTQNDLIQ